MPWIYISRYRLILDILKKYLEDQFPSTTIYVHHGGDDYYAVQLPRDLTESQLNAIEDLRSGSSDTQSAQAWTAPSSQKGVRHWGYLAESLKRPESSDSLQSSIYGADSSGHTAAGTIPSDSGYASLLTRNTIAQKTIENDRLTIRSSVPTIEEDSDVKTALVRAFVDELSSHLTPFTSRGLEQGEKQEHAVEVLLKTFVKTLESTAKSTSERQGVLFIRQQRRRISRDLLLGIESFEGSTRSSGSITPHDHSTHEGMGSSDILTWMKTSESQGPQRIEEENIPTGTDMSHYLEESRAFITQSDAFRWLIDQLTAIMTLVGIDNLFKLNHYMIEQFDEHAASKEVLFGHFVIPSRLDVFLEDYCGSESGCNLGDVLVVVRNATGYQMLSCRDYMRQTWPSSGETTLDLLQKTLNAAKSQKTKDAKVSLDGITLHLMVGKYTTSISICASKLRLCDMGAQICWLAAACQSPEDDEWVLSSAILISRGILEDDESQSDQQITLSFDVNIEKERFAPLSPSNDNCWQLLLKCSNIVLGFPIAQRTTDQEGIEIALEAMSQLAGARRVTIFDGKIILKGYASLLVAASWDHSSVTWHYDESSGLSRIPFTAASPADREQDLDVACLKGKRHFLGWTRSASQEAGTRSANYTSIKRSRSEIVSGTRFALNGINLSVSKYVGGGASFTLSERANILRLKREAPFERRIYDLSRMYAILYDELSQRGWLIDGASVVLHALRRQLAMPPYDQSRLFDISSFKYSEGYGGPAASMEALLNMDFRKTKVFESRTEEGEGPTGAVTIKEKVTYWTIESMIEDLWDVFEQMHDHQERLKSASGIELRFDRDILEGWSFIDLLSEPVLQARSVKLTPSGRGWVEFTRAIQAVTFLAGDFGDIIKSMHHVSNCRVWAQVPHHKDYLAVRLQLIKQICDVYGDSTATPLRLANGIYWHRGHQLFEGCNCLKSISGETCDRVQVLLPELTLGRKTHPGIDLADDSSLRDAAVIFGRSARWRSKDHLHESSQANGSVTSNDSHGGASGAQSPFSTPPSGQSSRSSTSTRLRWPFRRREQKKRESKP